MAKLRGSLAKRAEVLRQAALAYHAGTLTRTGYLRVLFDFRRR